MTLTTKCPSKIYFCFIFLTFSKPVGLLKVRKMKQKIDFCSALFWTIYKKIKKIKLPNSSVSLKCWKMIMLQTLEFFQYKLEEGRFTLFIDWVTSDVNARRCAHSSWQVLLFFARRCTCTSRFVQGPCFWNLHISYSIAKSHWTVQWQSIQANQKTLSFLLCW